MPLCMFSHTCCRKLLVSASSKAVSGSLQSQPVDANDKFTVPLGCSRRHAQACRTGLLDPRGGRGLAAKLASGQAQKILTRGCKSQQSRSACRVKAHSKADLQAMSKHAAKQTCRPCQSTQQSRCACHASTHCHYSMHKRHWQRLKPGAMEGGTAASMETARACSHDACYACWGCRSVHPEAHSTKIPFGRHGCSTQPGGWVNAEAEPVMELRQY